MALEDSLFEESPALRAASKASLSHYIALGERAGKKVRFIGRGYGYEGENAQFNGPHCVAMNGFSLHCARRVRARDRKGLENLLMYMARGPISTARLTRDDDGDLRYALKRAFADGSTPVLLSPIELLEKVAALIPPLWQNQLHYNGVFAPAAAWRNQIVSALKKKSTATSDESTPEESSQEAYRYSWSTLLKRVFNLNLDKCPLCGGKFLTVATITDPDSIKRILIHFGIGTDPPDEPQRPVYKTDPIIEFA
jgi:hypothetical protein